MNATRANRTRNLLNRPIADWPKVIDRLQKGPEIGVLQETESQLAAIIQRATLLHSYISHRFNTGCGDQGHKASAKVANRALVKVRKALGYSMPANTPLSIS